MEKVLKNKSFTYILPMLEWWDSDMIVTSQLRGVFIGDILRPELDNHIFLLYRFSGERWFSRFEKALEEPDYFVGRYEPDSRHVMFIYDVPEIYQDSYNMFKNSKYSMISNQLKERIIGFHGEENTRKIAAVMYRQESAYLDWEKRINGDSPSYLHIKIPRDQEASSILKMEDEIFSNSCLPKQSGLKPNMGEEDRV